MKLIFHLFLTKNLTRKLLFPFYRDRTRGGEGEGRGRDKSRTRNSREYIPRELTSESEQDVSRYSSANSKNTENNYRSTSITSLKEKHENLKIRTRRHI